MMLTVVFEKLYGVVCRDSINDNIKLNIREIRRITAPNWFMRHVSGSGLSSSFIRIFRQYPLFIPYREMSFRMSGMEARVCARGTATRTELDEDGCESSEMHISYAAIVSQIEERWEKSRKPE